VIPKGQEIFELQESFILSTSKYLNVAQNGVRTTILLMLCRT
jgi:hypothetical protein